MIISGYLVKYNMDIKNNKLTVYWICVLFYWTANLVASLI